MEGEFWAGPQSALVGWTYMSRYWPEYWASSKRKEISVERVSMIFDWDEVIAFILGYQSLRSEELSLELDLSNNTSFKLWHFMNEEFRL